jgi:hypothetical protein
MARPITAKDKAAARRILTAHHTELSTNIDAELTADGASGKCRVIPVGTNWWQYLSMDCNAHVQLIADHCICPECMHEGCDATLVYQASISGNVLEMSCPKCNCVGPVEDFAVGDETIETEVHILYGECKQLRRRAEDAAIRARQLHQVARESKSFSNNLMECHAAMDNRRTTLADALTKAQEANDGKEKA